MKKLLRRVLPLLLTLVMAVSLAAPVWAVEPGLTLSRTAVSLPVGGSLALTAECSEEAESQTVQWASSAPEVAAVSDTGEVTALTVGTAEITAAAGAYSAVCTVTVEENYVVEVSIEPLSPGTLLTGGSVKLSAYVNYKYKTDGTGSVTWSTTDSSVATVDGTGLVSAIAQGKAVISATAGDRGHDGTAVTDVYKLTVLPGGTSNEEDRLVLSPAVQSVTGSPATPLVLNAPDVAVMNGETNITGLFTVSYLWSYDGKTFSSGDTLTIRPTEDGTVVCYITAVSNTDKTHILTAAGVYGLKLLDGLSVTGSTAVETGDVAIGSLVGGADNRSIPDQLLEQLPDLRTLTFDPTTITGDEVGSLIMQGDTAYSVEDGGENPLAALLFSPAQPGAYSIGFVARGDGDKDWYGRLNITVTGTAPVEDDPADLTCGSEGIALEEVLNALVSESDPVAAVVFGTPKYGMLLRDYSFASGLSVAGERYYTADPERGDYPLSTLTYLPRAGFFGTEYLPVTVISQSGLSVQDTVAIAVKHRDTSQYFYDVTSRGMGSWAADSVDFARAFGLMNGTDPGLFSPYAAMSRGMLVAVLYRAEGSPAVSGGVSFRDVDKGAYYYDAVRWASANGIVTGDDLGNFNPEMSLTREQLATILCRYAAYEGRSVDYTHTLAGFRDASAVSSYAINGMCWAVEKGIISGTSELDPTVILLAPQKSASRAQVAVILHRYLTL